MPLAETIRTKFPTKRIAVVGDCVADQFLKGTITRVSREAPVFILKHEETETLPGGAANAAANVASLGGEAILIGLIGDDAYGEKLVSSLAASGVSPDHLVTVAGGITTTKQRVLAGQQYGARQQVIRIDFEPSAHPSPDIYEQMLTELQRVKSDVDAIVVSDYGYGAVTIGLFELAREISDERGIALIVDSRHRLTDYVGATTATPNQEEVEEILGTGCSPQDCDDLRGRLGCKALVVTNGNAGMTILDGSGPVHLPAVGALEPVDVTGAGDTVIAAYALGLASGLGFRDAASVANHAGGIVVMKKRTATVSPEELIASIERNSQHAAAKGAIID